MKFEITLLAAIGAAYAADASDVEFLTNLVNDYKSNGKSYINFLATAKSVPPELTSLAKEVGTYTDDSYTTLLDNSQLNVDALESFATQLPWYSRIVGEDAVASGSEAESVASETGSSSSESSHSSLSSASSSGSSSSSDDMAGTNAIAPMGVLLGALAVVLL